MGCAGTTWDSYYKPSHQAAHFMNLLQPDVMVRPVVMTLCAEVATSEMGLCEGVRTCVC